MRGLDYVCAPYAGDIEGNVKRAIEYGRHVYLCGGVPLIPHVNFQFFNEATQRAAALDMCCRAVSKCGKLWVFCSAGFSDITSGMSMEIETAQVFNIPIIYIDKNTMKWIK